VQDRDSYPAAGGASPAADQKDPGMPTGRQGTQGNPDIPTLALLQQSERAAEGGNLDEAIGYVERAIRLNPRDPVLWLRLAELQLSAGRDTPAIQMAQKAIALAGSRTDVERDAWLVVADARERLGEPEEANRIRARWRTYRG